MGIESNITCDMCGKKGIDPEEFAEIIVNRHINDKPYSMILCEKKCWRLFVKFWKDNDKQEVIEEE